RVGSSRLHHDCFDAIAHHIAGLACGDLSQRARGRLICDLGAPLPLRRENMNRALAKIILRVTDKSYDANVIVPEFLQIRLRLFVQETNEPQLGIRQVEAVPCLQNMLKGLATDQCTGKDSAKMVWPFYWPSMFALHAAGH